MTENGASIDTRAVPRRRIGDVAGVAGGRTALLGWGIAKHGSGSEQCSARLPPLQGSPCPSQDSPMGASRNL